MAEDNDKLTSVTIGATSGLRLSPLALDLVALPGYVQVNPQLNYEAKRGFGFLQSAAVTPDKPSVFVVDVEEGNYEVARLEFAEERGESIGRVRLLQQLLDLPVSTSEDLRGRSPAELSELESDLQRQLRNRN